MIVEDFEAIAEALKRLLERDDPNPPKNPKPVPRRTPTPEDDENADLSFYEAICSPHFH